MTNAPFILNVDCDMYANNSQIVFHAMCLLLGCKNGQDFAFAQSPQIFYDGLKDDPLGNQLVAVGTPPSENTWHASYSDTWHASYKDT